MVILVHTWLVEADTTIYGHFLWAEIKIILFIHLNNHLDGARGTLWMKFTKAKLLLLKLLQLFARDVLVMKKLEIEKTKPIFIVSVLKFAY